MITSDELVAAQTAAGMWDSVDAVLGKPAEIPDKAFTVAQYAEHSGTSRVQAERRLLAAVTAGKMSRALKGCTYWYWIAEVSSGKTTISRSDNRTGTIRTPELGSTGL